MNDDALVWRELRIDPTQDARAIRRAYAQRLKQTHPEDDAEGFQRLRSAYEHAMYLAVQQQAAQESPAEESGAAAGETPKDSDPSERSQAPSDEPDPEIQFVSETFNSLFARLHGTAPGRHDEAELLHALLTSAAMDRLEIMQRVEFALAEQLARSVPRSDHLLEAAAQRFNWAGRWFDRDLSQAARFVVTRLNDREQLQKLQNGKDVLAKAFARLERPLPSWRLWLGALAKREKPEIAVIRLLRDQHPNLLDGIPQENLQWWDRHASRPPLSTNMFWTGIFAAAVTVFLGYFRFMDMGRAPVSAVFISLGLGVVMLAVFALAIFGRHLLFDLPVHEAAKRWGSVPPLGVALGWVPAGVVLMALSMLLRNFPVIGWIPAGLSCLAVLWASYLAGPIVSARLGGNITELRSVRALGVNGLAALWVFLCGSMQGTTISPPAMVSMLTLLAASGIGLPMLLDFLEHRLTTRGRGWFLLAGLVSGLLVSLLVAVLGGNLAWYPLLAPSVIILVVLKRTILPNKIFTSGSAFLVTGALIAYLTAAVAIVEVLDIGDESQQEARKLAAGAVFLLLGVIVDFAWSGISHWRVSRRAKKLGA